MILKSDIEQAFKMQTDACLKKQTDYIERVYTSKFSPATSHVEIVSGVRRCGKSTILLQLMHNFYKNPAYFNFEEPQIMGFEADDFMKLYEVMGENRDAYFFDEIQNVKSWEIFIRSLHEKGKKVFITGSNATLLSHELGTRLTGRYFRHELFPFNYNEFLIYTKNENTSDNFLIYLNKGGFPEFLSQDKREVLHQLFRDVLYRDIAIRHSIKNVSYLEQIALALLSNVGKEISFNNLRKRLNIPSVTTVSDYINWLQNSYLIFLLPRFSYSPKSSMVNPKKVYAIDNGLINANTLSKSDDMGRLLENMVFLHLRRTGKQLFYFKEKGECDFVTFKDKTCQDLIQVCVSVNHDNKHREINGLMEALTFFKKNNGTIITLNQEDTLKFENKTISLIPAFKWLSK